MEGNAKGTVDNFTIKQMNIKSAGTTVKADISLRGLPDINTTFIDFSNRKDYKPIMQAGNIDPCP